MGSNSVKIARGMDLTSSRTVMMSQNDPNTVRRARQADGLFSMQYPHQVQAVMDERVFAQSMRAINEQAARFNPTNFGSLMGKLAIASALFFFALFAIMAPVAGTMFMNSQGSFNPMVILVPIGVMFIGAPTA